MKTAHSKLLFKIVKQSSNQCTLYVVALVTVGSKHLAFLVKSVAVGEGWFLHIGLFFLCGLFNRLLQIFD